MTFEKCAAFTRDLGSSCSGLRPHYPPVACPPWPLALVSAILVSALRSRERRFESCWGALTALRSWPHEDTVNWAALTAAPNPDVDVHAVSQPCAYVTVACGAAALTPLSTETTDLRSSAE
jgi:hypothetical protein